VPAVGSNGYKSFSLVHWPEAPDKGTAKGLDGVTTAVVKSLFPKGHEKIEFIITDTVLVLSALKQKKFRNFGTSTKFLVNLSSPTGLSQKVGNFGLKNI
jgi:hypothetical protein